MLDLQFARKAIEKLYIDTCNVYEYQLATDQDTHISNMQEVLVHENVPCKISHKTITQTTDGVAPSLNLVSKLIINPDIVIKPGSKIIVTRNGAETAYKNSGEPARYLNHQEIFLELFEEYA